MEIISLLLIGVSLSMDAFSLALCYGILDISNTKRKILSLIVGAFHFFMPLLGMLLGNVLEHYIVLDMRYMVFIIFMLLGIEMIISAIEKESKIFLLNTLGLFLFAFSVSVDSFSAGIGIKFISSNYLLCSIIFSLTSAFFTYFGLKLGEIIGAKYKNASRMVGGFILMIFALSYLFK